jgi:hypothetical protein
MVGGVVHTLEVTLANPVPSGTLFAQVVLRGFGDQQSEIVGDAKIALPDADLKIRLQLDRPLTIHHGVVRKTTEILLTWNGPDPLRVDAVQILEE